MGTALTRGDRSPIPVCRPRLPTSAQLLPYLRRIDSERWYSNFGPLASEFERRVAALFRVAEGEALTASSATAAIAGAILAVGGWATSRRPLCIMPSYTFVATAAAAMTCGYQPYFVDVCADDWSIAPDQLYQHEALARAGVVVPVAPFGRPFAVAQWEQFTRRTGIPAVIDAAAGFDVVAASPHDRIGNTPVALSLHATKVFGTGEGGLLLWRNAQGIADARRFLDFGMAGQRRSDVPGLNGKMSEYPAAVGLAELDGWADKRAAYRRTAACYRDASAPDLAERLLVQTDWASPYALFVADSAREAELAKSHLSSRNIDTRFWYGFGCHAEPGYAAMERDALPVTDATARRVLGLPMYHDMSASEIEEVVTSVRDALSSHRG